MPIKKLKNLLEEALNSSGDARRSYIKEFQDIVWNDESIQDDILNEILTDIAYDLDFYEPNEEWRRQDSSFYDDYKLEEVLKMAIEKL